MCIVEKYPSPADASIGVDTALGHRWRIAAEVLKRSKGIKPGSTGTSRENGYRVVVAFIVIVRMTVQDCENRCVRSVKNAHEIEAILKAVRIQP